MYQDHQDFLDGYSDQPTFVFEPLAAENGYFTPGPHDAHEPLGLGLGPCVFYENCSEVHPRISAEDSPEVLMHGVIHLAFDTHDEPSVASLAEFCRARSQL